MTKALGLSSFGGEPAPEGLAADLSELGALPKAAREELWEVLGPSLFAEKLPPQATRKLDVFNAKHRLEGESLSRSIRSARSLLRGAAKYKVSRAEFAKDLTRLEAPEEARAVLLPRYDEAVLRLRRQVAIDEVGTHGKLVTDVDWRVDRIGDSKKGKSLDVDIYVVTLKYREGGKEQSFTFQLLPDMLSALRSVGDL